MDQTFEAIDFDRREKAFVLVEFPYPSGSGLHMGHAFSFTGGDIFARYQRMLGKNVLFPIGWDAFGLPTENYAIRTGQAPQVVTAENAAGYHRQMDLLGLSFDWSREVNTSDPDFYRWTQWIFIQLFKKGLTSKVQMPINWCPKDKVGLANEEVINGRCERCGTPTVRRMINQWVVKITAYADRLLDGLQQTEFIEKVKTAQVEWIGKSEGARIRFELRGRPDTLEVFTTRPDTLWGATFLVLAPEHPLVASLLGDPAIARYVAQAATRSDMERGELEREKDGVFSGLRAVNPATGAEIPIWISDFVLMGYGSGAIMSVPAHDGRDHAFAKKFDLPILPVVEPPEGEWDFEQAAYEAKSGRMVNSGIINGLAPVEGAQRAIAWLAETGQGQAAASYHLRDWIFSRQHYWGEPIPMIHCADCGWQPVPEADLPVRLPVVEHYLPTDTGESPLANITDWVETTCPHCGGPARRETDTMPNWAGSDWYFLRYTDPHNPTALASLEAMRYWMPVDVYVGGDEHNTLHLLYSRFIYLFLHDLGVVPPELPEPYRVRLSHGVVLGPDGKRMSKTRGNVVIPEDLIQRYGADVLRLHLMFMAPFEATFAWTERPLQGVRRFLDRFAAYVTQNAARTSSNRPAAAVVDRLVKAVGEDLAAFKFNTAVAKQMEALNDLLTSGAQPGRAGLRKLVLVLAPFAPFLAEECWAKLGGEGRVSGARWPTYDPDLIRSETVEVAVQVNGRLRGVIVIDPEAAQETVIALALEIESVRRGLGGKPVQKVIYIRGRTINFVV